MIKKILYILCAGLLMACADTTEWDDSYLNGRDKTPVSTTALLDMSTPQSRAANNAFANGDVLLAYLRHVTWDGTTAGARTPITVDQAPLLVTFTNQAASVPYTGGNISPIGLTQELELNSTNTTQTTDLEASPTLFWDDLSEGGIGDPNNIRTDGHYLQSYYGYCYNGGTPLVALDKPTGTLGWQVPYDQTTADALQHSDLLWSAEQTPVQYAHGTNSGAAGGHGTILLPFTHALSMVTVDVIANDGFDASALANTVLELQNVNRKGTFTASNYSVTAATTDAGQVETYGKVKMFKGNVETNAAGKATCTYQAIVVPQTALALAQLFLKVNAVDGNHYILNVTDNMLTGWAAGLVDGKMQPGYNYHLTLTLNKAGIQVVAMLKDWIQVEATGTGIIQFSTDLRNIQPTESHPLVTGTSYYIYESTVNDDASYATAATERKYDESTTSWTNNPEIYWQGEGESRYFRGLAIMDGDKLTTTGVADRAASQGTDLVWATTPKHTGVDNNGVMQTVEEGSAIDPRTSEVPLRFEHAMSKVKFVLSTSTGDDAVDLTDAVISIADLFSAGTIDISTGNITPSTPASFATTSDAANIVIPQDLTDRRLTITLKDGTKYSVLLTNCVDSESGTQIGEWERGRSYTYKITLGKEAIQFRAMIKDWNNTEGKGNASLDWD